MTLNNNVIFIYSIVIFNTVVIVSAVLSLVYVTQYQDDITELNEIAKHRPRSHLVIGIAQENRQIRELQQENRELQVALEEHQSALELIMKKYREQVVTLIETKKCEQALVDSSDHSKVSPNTHLTCMHILIWTRFHFIVRIL